MFLPNWSYPNSSLLPLYQGKKAMRVALEAGHNDLAQMLVEWDNEVSEAKKQAAEARERQRL